MIETDSKLAKGAFVKQFNIKNGEKMWGWDIPEKIGL